MPKTLCQELLPYNRRRAALMWGPLALAGDQGPGHDRSQGQPSTTVFVAAERPAADWLKPVPGAPGTFRTNGIGRTTDGSGRVQNIDFLPLYRLHRRAYAAYWDLYTPQEWQQKAADLATEEGKQRQLEAGTVGYAQPGQMQTERDFSEQGEDTSPDQVMGRPGRRGRKLFSFDLPINPARPMALAVTYSTQEFAARTFNVLVDEQRIGQQMLDRAGPGSGSTRFFNVQYPVPKA